MMKVRTYPNNVKAMLFNEDEDDLFVDILKVLAVEDEESKVTIARLIDENEGKNDHLVQ